MALSSPPTPSSSSTPPPRPPASIWLPNRFMVKEEASKREEIRCMDDQAKKGIHKAYGKESLTMEATEFLRSCNSEIRLSAMSRKRPAQLVIPDYSGELDFGDRGKKLDNKEFEVKGRDFFVASKKGSREVMEDRHAVMLDIAGDPTQAFFAVIDGHGGHAAADYVAENLGKNVAYELQVVGNEVEAALRRAYSATDEQFLSKGENGGACAVGVLLKNGELYTANVGDCKAVLSRKGNAVTLTNDHRLITREDECARIENSGGFLYFHNGVCRVNGSIAVSRAFGDIHLKDWIISEPEIVKFPLTSDCDFLILASDGLWDKISSQEAVDVVLREGNQMESCRKLVDISSGRGNNDDITILMINLNSFKINVA
ncbi:unnamed protein product [Fraxinus pennsylvanica]|uniref:PPM-type phosphatase domain-containing protein n=1 Tax=Fraxinus pennsylvanica TaxID=56036 RepID=A0AAD1YR03_9LAMI|nr:unnamed protein product [Fraxinus pennsylvanica]